MTSYLACDLGAESGRLILGRLDGDRLVLDELHRFANRPLQSGRSLHWDIPQLDADIRRGLKKAASGRESLSSMSVDSWGVDYVLLGRDGSLLLPAFHYRDERCHQGVQRAHARASREEIFAATGIQFMPFNTVYQLMAEAPERLEGASHILGIADAFNFLLCGEAKAEVSFASTTQLYNPLTRSWATSLIGQLGLPPHIFPAIIPSGRKLGCLRAEVGKETGLPQMEVVAGCSHDTGAAVVAVPMTEPDANWAYLSSGTWSLMGVELTEPIVNDQCRAVNFTNEVGYDGTIRLLKNISGLWILQECRRHWAQKGQEYDYGTLTSLAAGSAPFLTLINPADPRFVPPGDMPGKIAAFCRETGQAVPAEPGAVVRCIFESLALLYRQTLAQLAALTGKRIERLHIVGGGSKNQLLNQFTANAVSLPVFAGPVEATAAGNILIQALAHGHIDSLTAARKILARSYQVRVVAPAESGVWDQAFQRFLTLG